MKRQTPHAVRCAVNTEATGLALQRAADALRRMASECSYDEPGRAAAEALERHAIRLHAESEELLADARETLGAAR